MASTIDDPEQVNPWNADPNVTQLIKFGPSKPLGEQYLMREAVGAASDRLEYKWNGKVEYWVGNFLGRLVQSKATGDYFWDCRIAWWCNRRLQVYFPYTAILFDEEIRLKTFHHTAEFSRDCTCVDPNGPGYSWWHRDNPVPVTLTRIDVEVVNLFDRVRSMQLEVDTPLFDPHNNHGPICQ